MRQHADRLTAWALMLLFAGGLQSPQALAQPVAEAPPQETAEEKPKTVPLSLAEGDLRVAAPASWKQIKPRNRIIEAELAIPANRKDGDGEEDAKQPAADARLTIMAAGGSVDANLARWAGQFRPEGEAEEPKIERDKLGEMKLTWFDASGTFLDSPRGPFGPKVEMPGHRMMAAILETGGLGNYFFKLVGPTELIEENAEAFRAMVASAEKTNSEETGDKTGPAE